MDPSGGGTSPKPRQVRVAAVQAAPVFLNREATVDKAVGLIEKAAAGGAGLVVFPETFVPTYPDWVWRTKPWDAHHSELTARLLDQAVTVPSAATEALGAAAAREGVWLSIGVDERDRHSTTLYNSQLLFSADGALVQCHRKLMPTGGERLVWGMGDGSTVGVVETPYGLVGTLACWENYMPLARAALYGQGVDIYLAPTWDNSDVWVASMRHIAKEGRCFVVAVNYCLRGSDVPADVPGRDELYGGDDDWMSRGNTMIVGPDGDVLAGPLEGEEGILYADIDATRARTGRLQFDPVGHYGRADVFRLTVDASPRRSVSYTAGAADEPDAAGEVPPPAM
jgi:nitrilase